MMTDELNKMVDIETANTEKILRNEYARVSKSLEYKLRALYQEISESGEPLLSHLYQYNKYYDLINAIQTELTSLGQVEKKTLETHLITMYKNNAMIMTKYGNNFTPDLNSESVKRVVNMNWGGRVKTWSDSVWANKSSLAERIRSDMVDIISTGKSYREVSKMLSHDMGVGYHESQRLIRTEMARISAQSTLDTYATWGVNKVKVLVNPDCCDICKEHANEIVKISEAQVGINIPPYHPNGRCSLMACWEGEEQCLE
jgi:SPP1 gp7 family putative phage head morphogenesis protein